MTRVTQRQWIPVTGNPRTLHLFAIAPVSVLHRDGIAASIVFRRAPTRTLGRFTGADPLIYALWKRLLLASHCLPAAPITLPCHYGRKSSPQSHPQSPPPGPIPTQQCPTVTWLLYEVQWRTPLKPCACSPNHEATTTNYQGTNASPVCFISNSTTGIYHRLIVLAWQQSSRPPLSIVRGVQTCIYYRAGQTCASTPSLQEPHQYNYSPHRTSHLVRR